MSAAERLSSRTVTPSPGSARSAISPASCTQGSSTSSCCTGDSCGLKSTASPLCEMASNVEARGRIDGAAPAVRASRSSRLRPSRRPRGSPVSPRQRPGSSLDDVDATRLGSVADRSPGSTRPRRSPWGSETARAQPGVAVQVGWEQWLLDPAQVELPPRREPWRSRCRRPTARERRRCRSPARRHPRSPADLAEVAEITPRILADQRLGAQTAAALYDPVARLAERPELRQRPIQILACPG